MVDDRAESLIFIQPWQILCGELRINELMFVEFRLGTLTSRAASNLDVNSCRTKLICRLCGTYAIPPLMNTLLWPTKSGTVYQGTLNQLSARNVSSLSFAFAQIHFFNCSAYVFFSSLDTSIQLKFSAARNCARSDTSSVSKRDLNNATSERMNRDLKSGLVSSDICSPLQRRETYDLQNASLSTH